MISSAFWRERRTALAGAVSAERDGLGRMLERLTARVNSLDLASPEHVIQQADPSVLVLFAASDTETDRAIAAADRAPMLRAILVVSADGEQACASEARPVRPMRGRFFSPHQPIVIRAMLPRTGESIALLDGLQGLLLLAEAAVARPAVLEASYRFEIDPRGEVAPPLRALGWKPQAGDPVWSDEPDPLSDTGSADGLDRYLGRCVRLTTPTILAPASLRPESTGEPDPEALRGRILDLVAEYHALAHRKPGLDPNKPSVPVSGRVYGARDMQMLVDSALDFWLTTGRFNDAFETRLAARIGVKHALTVNSGSSANLAAFSALTSPRLKGRQLQPGDEVITCATGFPTTVNPVLHWGMVPVFVDVHLPTYNIDIAAVEAAITPRTRAIMVAHTLGNPFDVLAIRAICDRHGLFLIEDCCDALGATVGGRHVGTFGDLGTLSFYPAHHITMGEGGAVFTNDNLLDKIVESFRDWGRDCYCDPGCDNSCNKRFGWQLGDLPKGYDHKYIYSHLGFNLKITDMQAAVGLAQLDRLDGFIDARQRNFDALWSGLSHLQDLVVLPEATAGTEPSWFGFPITLRENTRFTRDDLVIHLNQKGIGTRLLFGGNLVRQPYMKGRNFRIAGSLANADTVVERTFWIGVYPGLGANEIGYMLETLDAFCRAPLRLAV